VKITVIGNGVSRAPIPLDKITGITIGCNAIYRDYSPTYLTVIDYDMMKEIYDSGYEGTVYYRYRTLKRLELSEKDNWFTAHFVNGENAGNAGILMAKELEATSIDLIGFDGISQKLYSDTSQPNDKFDFWNERMKYLCSDIPTRRIIDDTCPIIDGFNHISVEDYIKELDK